MSTTPTPLCIIRVETYFALYNIDGRKEKRTVIHHHIYDAEPDVTITPFRGKADAENQNGLQVTIEFPIPNAKTIDEAFEQFVAARDAFISKMNQQVIADNGAAAFDPKQPNAAAMMGNIYGKG